MKSTLHIIIGTLWVVAGLLLAVTTITFAVPHEPQSAMVVTLFALLGALGGYFVLRQKCWAKWMLVCQALVLVGFAVSFFVRWGFGNHGAEDWKAFGMLLFGALTIAALSLKRIHEQSA